MIWGLACEIISPKAHVQEDLLNPRLAFLIIIIDWHSQTLEVQVGATPAAQWSALLCPL